MIDEFPPVSSADQPAASADKDVVDGELFFDLASTPTSGASSPTVRPIKSAQLEVGGKGLQGGGIWKVADKPRSGMERKLGWQK